MAGTGDKAPPARGLLAGTRPSGGCKRIRGTGAQREEGSRFPPAYQLVCGARKTDPLVKQYRNKSEPAFLSQAVPENPILCFLVSKVIFRQTPSQESRPGAKQRLLQAEFSGKP